MPQEQAYTTDCSGGLDLATSTYELLNVPSVAASLTNFEVDTSGGYRRINGFTRYGEGSATDPETSNRILGIVPYALGVVVCVNTSVYYSEDGISWLQINKDTTGSGLTEANMPAAAALDRPNQGQAQFELMSAPSGRTTTTYGSLSIATGADALARFRIEGTGAGRLFYYEEFSKTPAAATYIAVHQRHLCVVDAENDPSTVYYSANDDDSNFTGTGSGSVTIPYKIVGIKSFRDDLYIFCSKAIYRLTNINVPSDTAVLPVATNIGCISGYTIQEIGGDLIYLAQDGLRTIAGTERLSDVELGSLSVKVKPLIEEITANADDYVFSSVVLRNKSQYRLFYSKSTEPIADQKGLIGTFRLNESGQFGFEWSQTKGIEVTAIGASFDDQDEEVVYHGDYDGKIFIHNSGNDFNGSDIEWEYSTPDLGMGDASLRKTLKYMLLSLNPEAAAEVNLQVKYDFNSDRIMQPALQSLDTVTGGGVYGIALYGTSVYGQTATPQVRIPLRGSGTSAAFVFSGTDSNAPFTITGFYIIYVPIDRR